jgi:hypothetical protein
VDTEANKDLVRRFADTINAADWEALDDLMTQDFRRHSWATADMPEISSLSAKMRIRPKPLPPLASASTKPL